MPWPATVSDQLMASTAFWGMQSDTTDQSPFLGWPKDYVEADSTDSPEFTYTMQSSDGSELSYDLQQQQFGMQPGQQNQQNNHSPNCGRM